MSIFGLLPAGGYANINGFAKCCNLNTNIKTASKIQCVVNNPMLSLQPVLYTTQVDVMSDVQ